MDTLYTEYEVPAVGSRAGMVVNRPKTLLPDVQYRLVVALSGVGQIGTGSDLDLDGVRTTGNWDSLERRIKQKGNYIVVYPQTLSSFQYGEAEEARQWALNEFKDYINPKWVYITGLSNGGGGTHQYLAYNADADTKFAAAAIVCPGPNQFFIRNGEEGYRNIANTKMPLWYLHSIDDPTVKPAQSTDLTIGKIKAINPEVQVRRTLYKYEKHGAWVRAYGDNPAATPALADDYNDPVGGLLEFFELNEIGQPARFLPRKSDPVVIVPPVVTPPKGEDEKPPVITPIPTDPTTPPVIVEPNLPVDPIPEIPPVTPPAAEKITIAGWEISGNTVGQFQHNNTLTVKWSNGETELIKAVPGDRCIGIGGGKDRTGKLLYPPVFVMNMSKTTKKQIGPYKEPLQGLSVTKIS